MPLAVAAGAVEVAASVLAVQADSADSVHSVAPAAPAGQGLARVPGSVAQAVAAAVAMGEVPVVAEEVLAVAAVVVVVVVVGPVRRVLWSVGRHACKIAWLERWLFLAPRFFEPWVFLARRFLRFLDVSFAVESGTN